LYSVRCLAELSYTTAWAAQNFLPPPRLLTGVGQAFAFIGLVGCIVLQAIFAGAWPNLSGSLLFSAFFHTIRIFGGTAGAIYMGHFVGSTRKAAFESLGLHVSNGNWITDQEHSCDSRGLYLPDQPVWQLRLARRRGSDCGPHAPSGHSLSINDGFLLIAWSCVRAR